MAQNTEPLPAQARPPEPWELQVIGELLSHHILQNYDKFVAGIDSISAIEIELASLLQIAQVRPGGTGGLLQLCRAPLTGAGCGAEWPQGPGTGQTGHGGRPAGCAGRPAEGAGCQAAGRSAAPALHTQPGQGHQVPQPACVNTAGLCAAAAISAVRIAKLPPTITNIPVCIMAAAASLRAAAMQGELGSRRLCPGLLAVCAV